MAQHLSELCVLLIEDLYGELCSRVFSALARQGRLPLSALPLYSGLSARHLRHGLVVLIQQHLVLHYTSEDNGITYYEANWQNAYALVRSGKIIKLVEDRFEDKAGTVISNLLLLGHARVGDLAAAYGVASKRHSDLQPEAHHINGEGLPGGLGTGTGKPHTEIKTVGQLHAILDQLLQSRFILPVRDTHFRPAADLHADAERIVKREMFPEGVKGTKKKIEFAQEVNALKRKWRDDGQRTTRTNGVSAGVKRSSSAMLSVFNKRPRLNGHLTNGTTDHGEHEEDDTGPILDDNLAVRVNHEKCNVALRSQQLTDLAARYIGETTSKVYEAFLRQLEEQIPRCYDEYATFEDAQAELKAAPTATSFQAAMALDPAIDLAAGLSLGADHANGINGEIKHDSGSDTGDNWEDHIGTKRENGIDGGDTRERGSLVALHLRILGADPRKFVNWISGRGQGEFQVDFRSLAQLMIQHELENTVRARFGGLAARLVRILNDKGKLDEKQLSTFALVRQKDIRATLTAMQEVGFVEAQEVPKDNSRQPSRTLYLWFFDQGRCRQLILTDTYKAMARLLQRIKVEKAKVQAVIDKAERTDVVGNEDRYLSNTERQALRSWREIEEKLLTQLGRQDDLVAVLRDFAPPPL